MSIDSRAGQYGSVFGQWKLREYLGGGSGGKTGVFRLVRLHDGWEETCALKVVNILEEVGQESELTDAFRRDYQKQRRALCRRAEQEVQMMYRLGSCPQVVNYLDYNFVDWQESNRFGCDMLIRMELLSSLEEVRRRRRYEEAEVLRLGREIAMALIRCHQENILHRDIKPANIFVTRQGDYKLGDFGIARMLDDSQQAYTSIGTQAYVSPEQYRQESYDHRVDVYSLGLTLYELSNRHRLPFAETSYARADEIQRRLVGEPLPPPSEASPALAAVIRKACAYDPKDRYQTVQELLDALNQIKVRWEKKSEPVEGDDDYATLLAEPAETGQEKTVPRKGKPRGKVWPLLAAALAGTLLIGGWYFLFGPGNRDDIHTYSFHVEDCTWEEAFVRAREKGGHLVRIDSRQEWKYLQEEADAQGYQEVLFLLGGRRDADGREYRWVDRDGLLIDPVLNEENRWTEKIWLEGEPSFSYEGYQETYLCMQYQKGEARWVWNDIVNDELMLSPGMAGRIGYIVEYSEETREETDKVRYAYEMSDITWSEAMEAAKAAGGFLAHIRSQEEFEKITADLESRGDQDKLFYLGGRRDLQGTDYFWVDENNRSTARIDAGDGWTRKLWIPGEPSLTYKEFDETCLVLQYDKERGRWGWNDVADDIFSTNPSRKGEIGYIVAFDQ